jgi:hypothetical protein
LCIPMSYDPETGLLSEGTYTPVFKDETSPGEKPEF